MPRSFCPNLVNILILETHAMVEVDLGVKPTKENPWNPRVDLKRECFTSFVHSKTFTNVSLTWKMCKNHVYEMMSQ